jgi:N-methylhydantoinase A
MARAIRAVSVERGLDPRDFTIVATGGNGGIHAIDVARQLGIKRIVIPILSGVFSAVGMLASDLSHSGLRTLLCPLSDLNVQSLRVIMDGLAAELTELLAADGYPAARIALDWEAELRHEGQASELSVQFDADGDIIASLRERFVAEYLKTYGYRDETAIELVKIRLTARGLRERQLDFGKSHIEMRPAAPGAEKRLISPARGEPSVWVPMVNRSALADTPAAGPLVIEEFDATIVVPGDATVHRDRIGNVVIDLEQGA